MLRQDLAAANILHEVKGKGVIDFHSFRAFFVTSAVLTRSPAEVIKRVCRLSTDALVERYLKLPSDEIDSCIDKISVSKIS